MGQNQPEKLAATVKFRRDAGGTPRRAASGYPARFTGTLRQRPRSLRSPYTVGARSVGLAGMQPVSSTGAAALPA